MVYKQRIILAIVPQLPPATDGVGDYALNLASQLHTAFNIDTHFLVCKPSWSGDNQIQGFQVTKVSHSSTSKLIKELSQIHSSNLLLLHYVGYGYAKRGCPDWLVKGIETWKTLKAGQSLVTMFHEIAASGPFWTSAFWLSSSQHGLAKRLVRTSDRILTSKRSYAELLESYAPERFTAIPSLPVFSTVGELQNPSSLSERTRRLVIFGGRSKRTKVYEDSLEQLHQICRYLDIQQIFDIGPPLDALPANIDTVPITATGCLPSEEVSTILSDSIAGFFSYHPAFLGKSTIFAAYCAHRMLPVSAFTTNYIEDSLYPGKHYILPEKYSAKIKNLITSQLIADNAYYWYQDHCLASQTQTFASYILEHIII